MQMKMDDEVKVAPWNTTRAYVQAMKNKCLLQLTGPADPTGCGEGFSYVRVPNKPTINKVSSHSLCFLFSSFVILFLYDMPSIWCHLFGYRSVVNSSMVFLSNESRLVDRKSWSRSRNVSWRAPTPICGACRWTTPSRSCETPRFPRKRSRNCRVGRSSTWCERCRRRRPRPERREWTNSHEATASPSPNTRSAIKRVLPIAKILFLRVSCVSLLQRRGCAESSMHLKEILFQIWIWLWLRERILTSWWQISIAIVECQRIFDLQNRVLASEEVLSTDEGESSEEDISDIEEMGKNIENMLANKKTSSQLSREREEHERRELQKMMLLGISSQTWPLLKLNEMTLYGMNDWMRSWK